MARQATQQGGAFSKIGLWLWVSAIFAMIVVISPATVIVFLLGALPTAVAWLVDRSKEKFATYCVGGLNLCGVFPYLLKIWFEDDSITAALNIVSDVFALAVMFASAGFGWAMFMSIPPVVAAFLNVIAQRRVIYLRSIEKAIVDEWGNAVAEQIDPPGQPLNANQAPSSPSAG